MLLRESAKSNGNDVNLSSVVEGAANVDDSIPAGRELIVFAESVVGGDHAVLEKARADLLAAVTPEQFVDAAAVAGNFERMVRIADGTGIKLDEWAHSVTADMREELGLNKFSSATHTFPES